MQCVNACVKSLHFLLDTWSHTSPSLTHPLIHRQRFNTECLKSVCVFHTSPTHFPPHRQRFYTERLGDLEYSVCMCCTPSS